MNYLTDIAPLESAGLSDSQIAEILSCVTVRPVKFVDFNNFTYEEGLAWKNPITLQWEGPLPSLAVTEGHPLQEGIAKLYSHLNKPQSSIIDTSIGDVKELLATGRISNGQLERQPWCILASQLLTGLLQAEVITESHRDRFYTLGGGIKFADVTNVRIDDVRQQYLVNQERLAAVGSIATRSNEANAAAKSAYDSGMNVDQILVAAEAAWAGE